MQAGGREGWRHKPVQLTKSFVPHRGWEWGTPVFYGGGVLSFYSQSFRSVSETEGKKKPKQKTQKPTKQQTNMLHMRTWPESPSTALAWFASARPWISPSFPPCSVCPAHSSHLSPVPPLSPRPGTGLGWLCPIPQGWVAFPSSKRSKSPCLTGHVASKWQLRHFPELWGCSCSLHWQH